MPLTSCFSQIIIEIIISYLFREFASRRSVTKQATTFVSFIALVFSTGGRGLKQNTELQQNGWNKWISCTIWKLSVLYWVNRLHSRTNLVIGRQDLPIALVYTIWCFVTFRFNKDKHSGTPFSVLLCENGYYTVHQN